MPEASHSIANGNRVLASLVRAENSWRIRADASYASPRGQTQVLVGHACVGSNPTLRIDPTLRVGLGYPNGRILPSQVLKKIGKLLSILRSSLRPSSSDPRTRYGLDHNDRCLGSFTCGT